MSRTTIDVDDAQLAAAARELGTTSKVETVNAALAYVAQRRQRAEAFDDPLIWGSPDLARSGGAGRGAAAIPAGLYLADTSAIARVARTQGARRDGPPRQARAACHLRDHRSGAGLLRA